MILTLKIPTSSTIKDQLGPLNHSYNNMFLNNIISNIDFFIINMSLIHQAHPGPQKPLNVTSRVTWFPFHHVAVVGCGGCFTRVALDVSVASAVGGA